MEKLNKKTLEQFSKLTLDISSLKKDTDNPYFKSKYVELSDILTEVKKKIHEYGFTLLQYVIYESEKSFLQTDFVFQENGEVVSGKIPLVFQNPDMQKLGSAITYARRYALMTMLNIETEDDDGNIASETKKELKKVEDFENAIKNCQTEKAVGALWYKWKEIFLKDSAEYKKLNQLSSEMKIKIGNPGLIKE